MPEDKALEALLGSVLAKDLTGEDCNVLAPLIRLTSLADGEIVCPEGKSDSTLHVVVKGKLTVAKQDPVTGEWQTLHVLGPGDLAGELSFIDETPHYAALRAMGPTEIFGLERRDLESLLDRHPWVVYHVMRAIMRTAHTIQRRLSMQALELTNYIYKQHGRY